MRSRAGGSRSASPAPFCRTSSAASASASTRAARASPRAWSRCGCCSSRRTSPATATFKLPEHHLAAAPDAEAAPAILGRRAGDAAELRSTPARPGHSIMAIPLAGEQDEGAARRSTARRGATAGHPGKGRVMLAFHMFCHENRRKAWDIARDPMNRYLRSLVEAASDWLTGRDRRIIPATTRSSPS